MWIINYLGYFAYRLLKKVRGENLSWEEIDESLIFSFSLLNLWAIVFILMPLSSFNDQLYDYFFNDSGRNYLIGAISVIMLLQYFHFFMNEKYVDIFSKIENDKSMIKNRRIRILKVAMILITLVGIIELLLIYKKHY